MNENYKNLIASSTNLGREAPQQNDRKILYNNSGDGDAIIEGSNLLSNHQMIKKHKTEN